jgi:methylglutaconyl-CoA hydratase
MTDKVLTQIDDDGNAAVLLNRPDVHNAFNREMVEALTDALEKLDADKAVRAVVLMGAGENFCAGADIAEMKKSAGFSRQQNLAAARRTARMLNTLYELKKPTIACVKGAVRGGGVGLVAACDIAIASRLSTFRLSEVKLGIIPSMIGPYVIAAIGQRMAKRYMLTGEEFDVAEAYRLGLVHDIVEEENLITAAGTLLARLYSSAPGSIAAIKDLVRTCAHAAIDETLIEETSRRIAAIRVTPEAQEGLAAFLEKRQPAWVTPPSARKASKAKPKARPRR